jgi:hypothetical protein
METVQLTVYSFNELSEQTQKRILDERREDAHTDFIYDEAHNTVKAFNRIFNVKEGRNSWLEFRFWHYDDNILELKGLRLRKWLINNFWSDIYKGKYFGTLTDKNPDGTKVEVSKEHPIGKRHIKRHSKVIFVKDYTLTGVYYDYEMLQPIFDFIDNYTEKVHGQITFGDLIQECFEGIKNAIESEVEEITSDEYLIQNIEDEGTLFFKNGEEYIQ